MLGGMMDELFCGEIGGFSADGETMRPIHSHPLTVLYCTVPRSLGPAVKPQDSGISSGLALLCFALSASESITSMEVA